jgi:LmbE family N-acetylglucosaminyl deacetylase
MNVLAIGAHPDDIELGCAGALALHRAAGHRVSMLVMTVGEHGPQLTIARVREQEEAARILGADLHWGGLPDCNVQCGMETVQLIERVIALVEPDVVYSHAPRDSHQDHRAVAEATTSACRRLPRLCFYEGPTTLDFRPSLFVDVSDCLPIKLDSLRAHTSQVSKNGLVDLEEVTALARHRGFQSRIRYAEAFEASRYVLRIPGADSPVLSASNNAQLREETNV